MAIQDDLGKVIPAIFSGIKHVIEQQIRARGFDDVSLVKPEYVFTVGIFDALVSGLNPSNPLDGKYAVRLEQKTTDVKFKSFPAYVVEKSEGLIPKFIGQVFKKIDREGKVDIAVYAKSNNGTHQEEVVCLIEVKGFNPSAPEVKKDLKRLYEIKSLEQQTGKTFIRKACLAYLITEDPSSSFKKATICSKTSEWVRNMNLDIQINPSHVYCEIIDESLPNPAGYPDEFDATDLDASQFYRWVAIVIEV